MDGLGLRTYDLGPDHGHYKQAFCTTVTEVGEGLHLAASPAGRRLGGRGAVWTLIGGSRNPSVDRLRRRLDHIAEVELTLAGRLRGLAAAVSAYSVRGASRDLGGVDGMAN
jgi:hypothetical protein